MLRFIFLLFFSVFAATQAQAGSGRVFGAEHLTLENGLEVIVVPNHRAPVVTHMIWYKSGAIDEQGGTSGIAHFLEHLMFKGTERMAPGEFSRRIRVMGGDDNAFTSHDYTAFHETVSKDRLEEIMEMEADRMLGLLLPEADVESERQVIIEERRQRTENDPYNAFHEQLRAMLFINHPYGRPVIGWKQEMEKLSRADAREYYDRHYAPNNAIVVISGDVTLEEIAPAVTRIYGALQKRELAPRKWPTVPPLPALTSLVTHEKSVRQPAMTRLIRAPSYIQDAQESMALQVLAEILDGGSAARFYRTLVAEKKIASGINLSYDDQALSDGLITISLTPAEGVARETAESALNDLLRDLVKDGVTKSEVHEAKERLKDQAIFARDGLLGPASLFGESMAVGSGIEYIEFWPMLIDRVTKKQIDAVAKKILDPDSYGTNPYVTGWILPPETKAEATP